MPECEFGNNRGIPFDQPWLRYAIPFSDGEYATCFRYAPMIYTNGTVTTDECTAEMFNNSATIECTEFVYASDEKNLQTEVRGEMLYSIHFISIVN